MIKFTLENISPDIINSEINKQKEALTLYQKYYKKILIFIKQYSQDINTEESFKNFDSIYEYLSSSTKTLKAVKANVLSTKRIIKLLSSLKSLLGLLDEVTLNTTLQNFNKEYSALTKSISYQNRVIKPFIQNIAKLNILKSTKNLPKETNENVLVISEKQNKVILPFTYSEIEHFFEEHNKEYLDIEEVIEKNYTKPLKYYKNSAMSRFKEAYKLVTKREQGSIKDAIMLATEMFFTYNLHPAIITACKNLNELDIYLSCLEYDELDDFHFFKVVYEIAPVVTKPQQLADNLSI